MRREIIKTADGSATIFLPEWNEHYHSKHGAVQEALHVFIETGLRHYYQQHKPAHLQILEAGFGTGLNAFLTALEAVRLQTSISYTALEAFPVAKEELQLLNYPHLIKEEGAGALFSALHSASWEQTASIHPSFELLKKKMYFKELQKEQYYDLVYYDAFGPRVQPELWTEEVFENMLRAMKSGGVLVTYCAKGSVRRALQQVGFRVERLPGPPGKREMIRATC